MKAAILNPDMLNLAMLDSAILVFPLKVTHTCQDWFPPFAQNKLHSFSLTQLDDGSQLKFCHVGFIHFAKKKNFNLSFSLKMMMAAILNSAILVFPLKLTHTCQDWFPPFPQKTLHSFILTQLDGGSHFEFCHVGFRHCHLGFRHLVIFSQIHSKTLSLHFDSDLN